MNDCIFCKIIAHEIPSTRIYEDDHVLVIKDIHPNAPTHLLILPKKHIENLFFVTKNDAAVLSAILLAAKQVANELQIGARGFKLSVSSGRNAGQEIDHMHFHLLSDKTT